MTIYVNIYIFKYVFKYLSLLLFFLVYFSSLISKNIISNKRKFLSFQEKEDKKKIKISSLIKFLLKCMHKKDMKVISDSRRQVFFFPPKIDKYVLWS